MYHPSRDSVPCVCVCVCVCVHVCVLSRMQKSLTESLSAMLKQELAPLVDMTESQKQSRNKVCMVSCHFPYDTKAYIVREREREREESAGLSVISETG